MGAVWGFATHWMRSWDHSANIQHMQDTPINIFGDEEYGKSVIKNTRQPFIVFVVKHLKDERKAREQKTNFL